MSDPKIIVALDYATAEAALVFVDQVEPSQCALKMGKELFTAAGPDFVKELVRRGFKVFLDLKYHDIPNTVAKACIAAANLGVWMINVHTFGGVRMLQAAREAINSVPGPKPLLIGVT
jgi:orotidine-5'-phosphate decarboxylase